MEKTRCHPEGLVQPRASESSQVGAGRGAGGAGRLPALAPRGGHPYLVTSPSFLKNKGHMLFTLLATVSGGVQFPLSSRSRFPPFRVTLPPTPTSSRCSAGWKASTPFSRPVLRNAEQWFSKRTAASTLRGACQKFKGVGPARSCCRGNRQRARGPGNPHPLTKWPEGSPNAFH